MVINIAIIYSSVNEKCGIATKIPINGQMLNLPKQWKLKWKWAGWMDGLMAF